MRGSSAGNFALSWGAIESFSVGGSAAASVTIQRDGDVTIVGTLSGTPGAGDWVLPRNAAIGDDYEVRLTVNSGVTPAGSATGSWLALTSDRAWSHTRITVGTTTGNYTVEIRDTLTSTVQASVTFNMTATVDGGG